MSKLNVEIPPAGFEIVRDRVAYILADELDNQFKMSYDTDLEDLEVDIERNDPIDKTETPRVVVSVLKGDYANRNQGSTDGTYQYAVEVYTNAKSEDDNPGDLRSAKRMQKILRMCRYILEDPVYKTLGITPPYIMRTWVSGFDIAKIEKVMDGLGTSMCRMVFNVTVNERNTLIAPTLIDSYQTSVKLGNTTKGFFFEGETY